MSDSSLAAYVVLTTLLVATPGSATAVVVRNALHGGRRRGLAAAAGAAIGNTTYAVLSAFGLASVFARSPRAFVVLQAVGTAYFGFLGVRSLWAAWRATPAELPGALEAAGDGRAARDLVMGLSQGAATNLLSPAIVTFYVVVVPSFLNGAPPASREFALLAGIHVTMAVVFHSTWVLGLHAMRSFWSRPIARRVLETLTGMALIGLAGQVGKAL